MAKRESAFVTDPRLRDRTIIVILVLLVIGITFILLASILSNHLARDIVRDLGIVVLTTGMVALLYELILRGSFESHLKKIVNYPGEHGVMKVFTHLPTAEGGTYELIKRATVEIVIVQTWFDDYLELYSALVQAARANCKIRILLSHPQSPHTSARTREYLRNHPDDQGRARVERSVRDIHKLIEDNSIAANIELRLYVATPVIAVYAADGDVFLGVYWQDHAAVMGPQFLVRKDSVVGKFVMGHIDHIWNRAFPSTKADMFPALN